MQRWRCGCYEVVCLAKLAWSATEDRGLSVFISQPGRALEASYASLPSPPLRKSPQGDGRPRLAWLPRTREDIVHPYWLFTNPYSVFIRRLIRRPLDPSLSLPPYLSFLFQPLPVSRLDATHPSPSRESFQCISPPAFTFRRIFLSKYFFNKHAYHSVDRYQRLDTGTSHWQVPSDAFNFWKLCLPFLALLFLLSEMPRWNLLNLKKLSLNNSRNEI